MSKIKDYQSKASDPSSAYKNPNEVLQDDDVDKDQKMKILQQWELDARELQVAAEEGMAGGESDMLRQVRAALLTLGETGETQCSPSKLGG